jgi:uncharacterized membrane protein YkvA (DUF1232 family)
MPTVDPVRRWSRLIKRDVYTVYLAGRDPRVPWYAKCLAVLIAGYALSPVDLIPDFIPVLGYVDDLIIVPLGIWLVLRMVPDNVLAELRMAADAALDKLSSRLAAGVIIGVWILCALTALYFANHYLGTSR